MSKRYFYGRRQADLFSFVRMPKLLFTEDAYDKLSLQAKVLYGFLLDRMSLSAENGWFDDEGRVYVYYTVAEIEKNFKCGNKKACSFLQELEDFELIEKKRQGLKSNYRSFIRLRTIPLKLEMMRRWRRLWKASSPSASFSQQYVALMELENMKYFPDTEDITLVDWQV